MFGKYMWKSERRNYMGGLLNEILLVYIIPIERSNCILMQLQEASTRPVVELVNERQSMN